MLHLQYPPPLTLSTEPIRLYRTLVRLDGALHTEGDALALRVIVDPMKLCADVVAVMKRLELFVAADVVDVAVEAHCGDGKGGGKGRWGARPGNEGGVRACGW